MNNFLPSMFAVGRFDGRFSILRARAGVRAHESVQTSKRPLDPHV